MQLSTLRYWKNCNVKVSERPNSFGLQFLQMFGLAFVDKLLVDLHMWEDSLGGYSLFRKMFECVFVPEQQCYSTCRVV